MIRNAAVVTVVACIVSILPQACNKPESAKNDGTSAVVASDAISEQAGTAVIPTASALTVRLTESQRQILRKMQMTCRSPVPRSTSTFGAAIDAIVDMSELNIYVAWADLAQANVSRDTDVGRVWARYEDGKDTLQMFLDRLCLSISSMPHMAMSIEYYIAKDSIIITNDLSAPKTGVITMSQARQLADNPVILDADERQVLEKMQVVLKNINFNGVSLDHAIEHVRQATGAKIDVNWTSLTDAGVVSNSTDYRDGIYLQLENVRAATCLELILSRVQGQQSVNKPVDCWIEGDKILIAAADLPERDLDAISISSIRKFMAWSPDNAWGSRKIACKLQDAIWYPGASWEPMMRGLSLSLMVEYISGRLEMPVYIDWRAIAAAGASYGEVEQALIHIKNDTASVMECFDEVGRQLKSVGNANVPIACYIKDGVIVVSNANVMKNDADAVSMEEARTMAYDPSMLTPEKRSVRRGLMKRMKGVSFNNIPLYDVVDYLQESAGVNIFVDWPALGAGGVGKDRLVELQMIDISVATCLERTLADISHGAATSLPIVYYVVDNVVVITNLPKMTSLKIDFLDTMEGMRSLVMDQAGRQKECQAVLDKMQMILHKVNFSNVPLCDVVDYLRESSELNVHADWPALRAAGVGKDFPVALVVDEIKFHACLEKVLDVVSNAKGVNDKIVYYVQDGVVIITRSECLPEGMRYPPEQAIGSASKPATMPAEK